MLNTKECLEMALPIWRELSEQDKIMLQEHSAVNHYPEGEVVFNPLKRDSGIYAVIEGRLRISIQTEQNRELLLYHLVSGEYCLLSLFSLMKKYNWDIYMETMEKSLILMIPEHVYTDVAGRTPKLEKYNGRMIFQQLADVVRITIEYALANNEQRLAGLLLRYQQMTGSLVLKITHEQLARDIGTAREVVSRLLKQFAADGIVQLDRGSVTILDMEVLEKIKFVRK